MLNGKLYVNRLTYQKTGDKIASTNNKHTDFEKKWFLQENDVLINGELDNRRGRKLYPNDLVEIPEYGKFMMEADK